MIHRGGATKVPITETLLEDAKKAHSRLVEFKERAKQAKDRADREMDLQKKNASLEQANKLDEEKRELVARINIAEAQMEEGSTRLKAAISSKTLVRSNILHAEELINSSLKRKKELQSELESLLSKIRRIEKM